MNKPQIITTPNGDELVVLAREDYDALVARAAVPGDEDSALARLAARTAVDPETAAGAVRFPLAVVEAIGRGDNPVKVFRQWRDLSQAQLAENVGTDQGTISALEGGRRRGPAPLLKKIATALAVPLDLIVPDRLPGQLS